MKEQDTILIGGGGGKFITVYIKSNMCIVRRFSPHSKYLT